jgi:hypothetical protein
MAESKSSKTARDETSNRRPTPPAPAPAPAAAPAPAPTETGKLTYHRMSEDEPIAVMVGNRAFTEGEAVQIDDPRQFAKLKANPYFQGKRAERPVGAPARVLDPKLADLQNELSEEAQEAREEANAANATADAAARALAQVQATAEAVMSPDRSPPITNQATNRP